MKVSNKKNTLQKQFYIKVWDLLKKTGSKDHISINQIHIAEDKIKDIYDITCKIFLQSLTDKEIYVKITELSYKGSNICDYCGKKTEQEIACPDDTYRYVLPSELEKNNELDLGDDLFMIDGDMSIDLTTPIVNNILLNDTIQHLCKNCIKKKLYNDDGKEDIEDNMIDINHPTFI